MQSFITEIARTAVSISGGFTVKCILGMELTLLASLNHNCIAAHRLGQCFSAPLRLLHFLCASLFDSFFGIGASLKKLSVEFSFCLNSLTASSLLFTPVISFAISTT